MTNAAKSLTLLCALLSLAGCGVAGDADGSVVESSGEGRAFGNDSRPVPAEFQVRQALGTHGRAVVFLNFAGQSLRYGGSSSKQNTTWLVPQGTTATIPAFSASHLGMTRDQAISTILAAVKNDYRAYDVSFTTTRPTSGDYTMVMIGGEASLIGEDDMTMGIAPLDEGNPNRNDIAFVFAHAIYSIKEISNCVSHEIGHSFGLGHVAPEDAIMHPTLYGGTLRWVNAALTDEDGTQDQPKLLATMFGAPTATTTPTAPAPSTNNAAFVSQEVPSTLSPGETFLVKLTFKNTGTTTWTGSGAYGLMAADRTWGGNYLGNTSSVAPGATKTFSFYARAPATAGSYKFQWWLTKDGAKFGATSAGVTIEVGSPDENRVPVGELELADGSYGRGWAFDADAPTMSLWIDIYIDDQYAGSVKADRNRTDLSDEGVSGNYHGFEFGMPQLSAGNHTVEAYAVDDRGETAYKLQGEFYVTQ